MAHLAPIPPGFARKKTCDYSDTFGTQDLLRIARVIRKLLCELARTQT